MKSQVTFKHLVQYSIILGAIFFTNQAQAGCPNDIERAYKLENFQCVEACDKIAVNETGVNENTLLAATGDCQFCRIVKVTANYDIKGDINFAVMPLIAGIGDPDDYAMSFAGRELEHAKYEVGQNHEPIAENFELRLLDTKIKLALQDDGEWNLIKGATCVENCESVRVLSDTVLIDTCNNETACNVLNISHQASCGAGYDVSVGGIIQNQSIGDDGNTIVPDPNVLLKHFTAEQMGASKPVKYNVAGVKFTFDLVASGEIQDENEEYNNRTTTKYFWQYLMGILIGAIILWVVIAIMKKRRL